MQTLVDAARALLGFELSKEKIAALRKFEDELLAWNERVNLTAIRDSEGVRIKHFLDSLTILKAWERTRPPERLIDVGTGAGFPGLVLKLVWPSTQVTLVESVQKKRPFAVISSSVLG